MAPPRLTSSRLGLPAATHRGTLLDGVVLLLNLVPMSALTRYGLDVLRRSEDGDRAASALVGLCCLGMFALPPTAAVLKRRSFHARRNAPAGGGPRGTGALAARLDPLARGPLGCASRLYLMLFYFVLALTTGAGAAASLVGALASGAEHPVVFVPLVLITFVAAVASLALIFRYFVPPAKTSGAFLASSWSDRLGDLCLFANMALFQVCWSLIATEFPTVPGGGLPMLLGNLFFGVFLTLMVYIPPRIFYLAEDIGRPSTWMMMLLANLPTMVRILLGTDSRT
jgi:hypothetical protein